MSECARRSDRPSEKPSVTHLRAGGSGPLGTPHTRPSERSAGGEAPTAKRQLRSAGCEAPCVRGGAPRNAGAWWGGARGAQQKEEEGRHVLQDLSDRVHEGGQGVDPTEIEDHAEE